MRTNNNRKSTTRPVWRILKRRGLLLLLPICLLTPAVYYYATKLPGTYRAKALVGAESPLPGLPELGSRVDPNTVNAQEQLRAIQETLLVPEALKRVVREFDLQSEDAVTTESKWFPWRSFLTHHAARLRFAGLDGFLERLAGAGHQPSQPSLDQAAENLKSDIQIQVESPTTFYLGYESRSPELASRVANRLAQIFVARTSTIRTEIVQQQDGVLNAEVERTRAQLANTEDALKSYKERASKQLPERFAANVKQLEDLQTQIQARTDKITEAEARRASIQEEMAALDRQGVLKQEPAPKSAAQISLEEKRTRLNQLKARYTPEYPEISALQREIREMERATPQAEPVQAPKPTEAQMRYNALKIELASIEPRVATYRKERDALASQVPEYQKRIDSSPGNEAAVSEMTKDSAMLRARYEALFAQQQEQRLKQRTEKTSPVSNYKILEAAQPPTDPASPRRDRIILFGLFASIAIGVAGVFLAEQMDTTFEGADEVENFIRIPVLSAIPPIPARMSRTARQSVEGQRRGTNGGLLETRGLDGFSPMQMRHFQRQRVPLLSDPQSIAGQQFGILALKIERRMRESDKQILAIASASGEEGKSVTALNVSLALAESLPGRVVLVDCDLRLPQLHRRLQLAAAPGFSDLLRDGNPDLALYRTRVGSLDVIPGGSRTVNPAALLGSARMRQILDRLRNEYEFIVLDSPPLIAIADGQLLADLSDAALVVVRARRTPAELVKRAVENAGVDKVLGVVLNDAEYAGSAYAQAYRHYQKHYLSRV